MLPAAAAFFRLFPDIHGEKDRAVFQVACKIHLQQVDNNHPHLLHIVVSLSGLVQVVREEKVKMI